MSAKRTQLDQALLGKIAEKTEKSHQYVREQVSKRAVRFNVTSEVALILWAKELAIGAGRAFRALEPHMQEQVQAGLPAIFAPATSSKTKSGKRAVAAKRANPISLAIDYLLSDEELKARCKDLLRKKRHFDRALREATTVLENRIKTLAGIRGRPRPEKLLSEALNPDPAKAVLVLGTEPSEQQGFYSICRGVVLFFRHPAHHEVDDGVTRLDALRFCAFVDVLLAKLGKAKRRK